MLLSEQLPSFRCAKAMTWDDWRQSDVVWSRSLWQDTSGSDPWPISLMRDSRRNSSRLYAKYRFRASCVFADLTDYEGLIHFFLRSVFWSSLLVSERAVYACDLTHTHTHMCTRFYRCNNNSNSYHAIFHKMFIVKW